MPAQWFEEQRVTFWQALPAYKIGDSGGTSGRYISDFDR